MDEITETEKIENMIYEIRGKQVMLDSDLARLYGCKNGTKEVNQAVKNNIEKFPERYCFQLNDFEKKILRSNILTAKSNSKSRTNPRVFTEQGIYMLATVLKSKNATNMTLFIMDAFVFMKKYILNDSLNSKMLTNHEERILKLEESFNKLSAKQNSIIYEAYEEIIIVDNYANKELFDILKNINKKIYVISKNLDNILINKYSKQYSNVTFINNDLFHDRYIILDRKTVYVSGMSLKDLGKKYSYMYKMNEKIFINDLVSRIEILL